jgi:DedD protein
MDSLLKQRLVGAIVLVALGVIFIPAFLEGPSRTLVPEMEEFPEVIDQQLSDPLDVFPTPRDVPAAPEQAVVLADPEPETASEAQDEEKTEEAEPAPPPVEQEAVVAPAAEPAEAVASAGPLDGWVVQAGSFSSEQNALRLRDKLRAGGFVTQVEKVTVAGKAHFRVRIGPFLERAEAERNQKQLRDKFALEGRVLSSR